MNPNQDPLDQAFGLLKARSRGRAPTNPDLEELVMREPMKATSVKKSTFVKAIVAAFVCAAIGGGVVAAGGVQRISEFLGITSATVEVISPDGENLTFEGIVEGNRLLDENGQVILTFDLAGGNQEGSVVNEDGEVIEASGEFEIAD